MSMPRFFVGFGGALVLGGLLAASFLWVADQYRGSLALSTLIAPAIDVLKNKKTPEELLTEALEKSKNIRGLYMTADVAIDPGAGATRLRNHLVGLATSTEINGFVIDVKEVCGPDYNEERLREFVRDLKEKEIWTIARIVVFKDASQIKVHPEWYLKRNTPIAVGNECWNKRHLVVKSDVNQPAPISTEWSPITSNQTFWRDKRGGWWFDPAHPGAREYILEFSKKMIDLGFDELQFDYIRFPSDGDVQNAIYPAWNGKTQKYDVMKSFFEFLNKGLKAHKPDIILSADLFGYAAIRAGDVGIGQRLDDIGDNFDYISFMVYPSHYYSGFYMDEDIERNLPVVNLNRFQAREYPGVIIERSLLFARDFLDGKLATSSMTFLPTAATSTVTSTIDVVAEPAPRSKARLRPWLEDFFHEDDAASGRPSGIKKVRLQIEAAERAEGHGWMLWNAANVYTEQALQKE